MSTSDIKKENQTIQNLNTPSSDLKDIEIDTLKSKLLKKMKQNQAEKIIDSLEKKFISPKKISIIPEKILNLPEKISLITEKTTQQHAERSNIQPIQNIINNEVDINHQNQKIVLNQKNIIQKQINQNNRPHPSENINSSKPISNTQTKAIPKQNTIIELTKKPIQTQIQTQAQKPPNIISLPIHKKPVPQQIQKKPLRAPSNTNLNTNVKNNTNEILSNILKPNLLSNILLKPAETNNNLIINNPEDDTQKANIKPPQERVIKEKPNNLNTKEQKPRSEKSVNPINTKPKQIDSSNSNPGIIPKENLKRKADVDIAVLAPIPEKKKIANEKARSNGNSASPKSNKSNFSEKPLSKIPLEEEKPKDAENKKEEKLVVKTTETIELETNFPVGKPIRKLERPKEAIIEKITEEKIDNLILEKSNEKVSEQANKPKRKSKSNEIIVQKITPNQNMSEMTQELHESKENDRQTSEGKEEQSKSKSKERAEMEIEETQSNINEEINKDFTVLNEILEKDNEKENKCLEEYEKIKKKMLELADVIEKVESKMNTEELEIISNQYQQNLKMSYYQRLTSLYEFFEKY